jgi:hypothetical protein
MSIKEEDRGQPEANRSASTAGETAWKMGKIKGSASQIQGPTKPTGARRGLMSGFRSAWPHPTNINAACTELLARPRVNECVTRLSFTCRRVVGSLRSFLEGVALRVAS